MHLIIYTSQLVLQDKPVEKVLADIRKVAKVRNRALGVTGVLIYDDGRFVQVLEGDKVALDGLMSSILKDPRHQSVTVLFDDAVEKREFSEWNMDTFQIAPSGKLTEEFLLKFRDIYRRNFEPSSEGFVYFMKEFLVSPEALKVMNL